MLISSLIALSLAAPITDGSTPPANADETVTYRVVQTTRLDQVGDDTEQVRWWISIPGDERNQDVLDFRVLSAPGPWRIETESDQGNRFLFVEVDEPSADALETVVEFTLRRNSVWVSVDEELVGSITDAHRALFQDELRKDAPHMEVSPTIQAAADQACGSETNVAVQVRRLLDLVADEADHYSKDPTKPSCGIGDAEDCMTNGGGCCTDLHSLFIALARARGIPARLQMGYRLLPKNSGKEVDPGYRCWPEYFVPAYGWVPADIVEADALEVSERARWLTGLSERRLWLNDGREFMLTPSQAGGPVNTMVIGYAEVDGVPARVLPEGELAPQLARTVHFVTLPDGVAAAR
jgi:transglutaminase-like putative cysteine protease